jgi:hypothetical protein
MARTAAEGDGHAAAPASSEQPETTTKAKLKKVTEPVEWDREVRMIPRGRGGTQTRKFRSNTVSSTK